MSLVNECILYGVVTWGVHLQVTFFGGGSFFFVIHLGDIIMIFCCTSARVFLKWNSSYSSLILLLLSIYLAYLSRKCGEECSSILIISFLCILIFWLFSSSCKPYFKYNLDYDLNIIVPRVCHLTAPKRRERMGPILLFGENYQKLD